MPFDTFDDAIRIANSSDYGLTAAIYTKDTLTANRATRAIDTGMVWVNNYNRNMLGTPFGGAKHSGYGREHCIGMQKSFRVPSMSADRVARHPQGVDTRQNCSSSFRNG